MGEGWGEGEKGLYFKWLHPPPLNSLPQGEEKWDFLRVHQYFIKLCLGFRY